MDVDKRALRRPNGPLGINTARPHIYRIRAELQSTLISSAATTTTTPVNLTTNLTDDKDNTNKSRHNGSVFASQFEMSRLNAEVSRQPAPISSDIESST
jgi:hypothetical protein